MNLRFKIGTQPVIIHSVDVVPSIGSKIFLPFPSGGGPYSVLITDIQFHSNKISDATFFGEWV